MFVNALDPELSSLASNAAVELDLLINGEQTDVDAVRLLGERLRQTLEKSTPDQPASDHAANASGPSIYFFRGDGTTGGFCSTSFVRCTSRSSNNRLGTMTVTIALANPGNGNEPGAGAPTP